MRALLLAALSLIFAISLMPGLVGQVSAQYRLQETPALNGLGILLFKDIELRLDGGTGNTAATIPESAAFDPSRNPDKQVGTQWYLGVFIDKPIVAHFLEMAYDCELWQRDWVPRDTWYRDLFFEPIRVVAFYRQGDFRVSSRDRNEEFYIGGRYSLDLGRIARHIRVFQK